MAGGTGTADTPGETLELLPMAVARPREALVRARAMLADSPNMWDASVARHVVGIVLRDFGDVNAAIRELRAALRLAHAAGSPERQADVPASLGAGLGYARRTQAGLARLDAAVGKGSGGPAGRGLMRRRGPPPWPGRH